MRSVNFPTYSITLVCLNCLEPQQMIKWFFSFNKAIR